MNKHGAPIGVGMTESKTPLGKFFRERRLAIGLSQSEAARLIGIKQNQYSIYERGVYIHINTAPFPRFAHALGCDVVQLNELTPKRKEPGTERGKFIRALREKFGLNIGELAGILGKKQKDVYTLEMRAGSKMKFKTAERLSKAFGLRVSAFNEFVGLARLKARSKLGRRVRSRRNKLHLTQDQLAERIGKSKAYVSLIEAGRVKLKFAHETRRLLADALGLDLSRLAP